MGAYLFLLFPRHLLMDGVGDLLLGSCLTQHGLPYLLPDGLYFSEYRGQGLLSSTASRGDLRVRIAAMARSLPSVVTT